MAIVFVGIDLAKNVFAVHGVDEAGKPALVRPLVPRARLHELIASLPPCTVAMEACTGAHHWARLFAARGHSVRLIAPKFVTPYRMSGARGKTDAADAAAICEAVQRCNMRFVPVKSEQQQSQLMVHRARQGFVQARTACINRIRGLLEELPGWANTVIGDLLSELHRLDERIGAYDRHIAQIGREDERARRLMQLHGVGETTATAVVAMIGNGHEFRCGRQFAAWLGLTPGQYGSGGKTRLGRITKAGDGYVRSLLILGARSVLARAKSRSDALSSWALALQQRRGYWKAVVAIAAKNARLAWAVLHRGEAFKIAA
jgi:transposase